jgi:hypothetical protein
MARLIVVIGPVSTRNISFVALKMLSGNLLRIENRKGYLGNWSAVPYTATFRRQKQVLLIASLSTTLSGS